MRPPAMAQGAVAMGGQIGWENKKETGEKGPLGPWKLKAKSIGTRRPLLASIKRHFTLLSGCLDLIISY